MKFAIALVVTAASLAFTALPAGAQLADQRSFMHGFWSNNYFVAQRQVYPRFTYAPRDPAMESAGYGGWVLHEQNW
jgi:hypothetical protein